MNEDASAWTIPSAPKAAAEAAPDQNVYELSRARTRALIAFDKPLRDRLLGMDKRSMELRPLEYIEVLEGAFASVKSDWPFAKIGINLEAAGSRFEGILRLIFLEYHLTRALLEKPCRMQVFRCSPSSSAICPYW